MKKLRLFLAILLAIVSASSMKATTYGPLLTAKWGTEAPFNGQCKFEYSGTTYQCQPGSTAIAASMVLYYWKYPTTTVGALDSYSGDLTYGQTVPYVYPELPATTFDWDNMKDEYTSYTEAAGVAVAELVRYAGRAQKMNYGVYGSSAKADNVVDMFKKFGYDSGTRLVNKSEYSESAWADLIQGEIKAGRPVVYMAANSSGSSHCFCIDGYNSSDDTYHVNFGWGETYNGWHEMNSFKYDSNTYLFNQNQKAVIGIQPARQPYAVVSDDGLTLTFYYDANKPTGDNVLDLPFTTGHYPATNNKNIITATFDPSFADCHDLTTTNTMFFMCDKLQTINNLEYLNTENVTDMAGMFYGCSSLESLDLSHFDTKNVTGNGMVGMFYECSSLKSLDVSSFEISDGLTDMKYMFYECSALETIYCAEGADWSTSGDKFNMFYGCTNLSGKYGSKEFKFDKNKIDVTYAKAYMGDDDEGGYFTVREPYAVLSDDGKTLTFYYDENKPTGDNVYDVPWGIDPETYTDDYPGWTSSDGNTTITTVEFDVSFGNYHGLKSANGMFYNLHALTTINNLEYLNTENVTSMSFMFYHCEALKTLNLGDNFDTSNVTSMYAMFSGCYALETLNLGDNFDTSNVTNMAYMFYNLHHVTSLDVSGFDTKNVESMEYMFRCFSLKSIDVSKFNTSKVTRMNAMFVDCNSLEEVDVSGFDTQNVTTMNSMFGGCNNLENIDVSKFNTSKVTRMSFMFWNCKKLKTLDLSSFNTEKVTTMERMFYGCKALETIYCAEDADWSGVEDRDYTDMFTGCENLSGKFGSKEFSFDSNEIGGTYAKVYDGTNGGYFTAISQKPEAYAVLTDNENGEGKTLTFYYDANKPTTGTVYNIPWNPIYAPNWAFNEDITTVNFDPSFGDYHDLTHTYAMFALMEALTVINGLKYLNTENVTNMENMFYGCSALKTLDLSMLDTKNVTNMIDMFYGCSSLESINLDGKFNTVNVTDMLNMFADCQALTTLDLSNFDTENVEDMSYMFLQCLALESLDVSNFNTENVTDMNNMFYGCVALKELDVSNFDTGNVTDMTYMFSYCQVLKELDLSNFDTQNVTNMSYMFEGSSSLETIYCAEGADWSGVAGRNYTDMFKGCTSLSGKCGSKEFKFDPEEIKGTYAKVYDGTNGGYFTYKGNRSYTLEVGEAGMATLYLDFDALIPEDIEVYCCEGLKDDEALPEAYAVKITQGVIPANTGVFVKAEPGKYLFNAFIPVETDGVTQVLQIYPDNILTGTLEDMEVGSHEVLTLGYSNQTNELGFWWFTGKTPIPANRAYIPGDKLTEGGVKGIRIVFDEETGIATTNLTNQTNEAGAWYTIDGRKLEGKPQQRGLYINNGKKIIIK